VTVPRVKRTTGDNMGTFAASGKEVACLTIDGRLLFLFRGRDAALGNNRWTGKNLCHRPASGRGQAPVGTDGELEVIE